MTLSEITKGKRVTGDARASLAKDMRKAYEAGATVRTLHADTGRSFGSIQRLLEEAGTTMRPRGGSRVKK